MSRRTIVLALAAATATTACQSPFAYLAQQGKALVARQQPADQLDLSGTVTLPADITELPTSGNLQPLSAAPPVSSASPLASASTLAIATFRTVLALPLASLSGQAVADTEVDVIDPATGQVLQAATTLPDGSYSLAVRTGSVSRGLLVETVLEGSGGPIGYLAAPLPVLATAQAAASGPRTLDLDAGSTAAVFAAMELAAMNQTFDLGALSTRQNTSFERLLARIDATSAISAATALATADGVDSAGDLSTATGLTVQAGAALALAARQGVLRFGDSPPASVSPEALDAAFVDQIARSIAALTTPTQATVEQAAVTAISSATELQIVTAAASADAAAGKS